MLAKLAEICPGAKPDDTDKTVYPAPWSSNATKSSNILHFSDDLLIDRLGNSETRLAEGYTEDLRNNLYRGLKYDRNAIYKTLLPVDVDLVYKSVHPISFFVKEFRGDENKPSNESRIRIENQLAQVSGSNNGDVIIYCPSSDMQAKEVDARLEIVKDRVLPLRVQTELFTYNLDVKVLEQYYKELWQIYIFVSPEVFKSENKCQSIVDEFCKIYKFDRFLAYSKVRTHDFKHKQVEVSKFIGPFHTFLEKVPFANVPHLLLADMLQKIGNDEKYLEEIKSGNQLDAEKRLSILFKSVILEDARKKEELSDIEKRSIKKYIEKLLSGEIQFQMKFAARKDEPSPEETFDQYALRLLTEAKQYSKKKP